MLLLSLAALLWIGVHVGIAGTRLRGVFAGRLGENGFRIAFSLLSVVAVSLLVVAWKAAPTEPLWFAPDALRWALAAVMLLAFLLFAGSVSTPNPTSAGQEGRLGAEPRGIVRITRHPMLWAFALWGLVHVIGNGELSATLFFGAFLVTALAGMPSIDAKLSARDPAGFSALAARTSIVPFAAIAAGRNRLSLAELGWIAPLAGVVVWALVLHFHPAIFGVQAVPE
jgi:uncharacterized membrane protein